MKTIVLYSNGCQECERTEQLLSSLGEEFLVYRVDIHFTTNQFRKEFGEDAEFPQIAIDTNHVGGLKETLQYLQQRGII